jgi:hypothetical protein
VTVTANKPKQQTRIPAGLLLELFQTERSAQRQSLHQARALGGTPPSRALEVVARHAAATLRTLPPGLQLHGLAGRAMGSVAGRTLVTLRRIADRMLGPERAYRMTLLGIHHGIDTVRAVRGHAIAAGDEALAIWCDAWLDTRLRLARNAEFALLWFQPRADVLVR